MFVDEMAYTYLNLYMCLNLQSFAPLNKTQSQNSQVMMEDILTPPTKKKAQKNSTHDYIWIHDLTVFENLAEEITYLFINRLENSYYVISY